MNLKKSPSELLFGNPKPKIYFTKSILNNILSYCNDFVYTREAVYKIIENMVFLHGNPINYNDRNRRLLETDQLIILCLDALALSSVTTPKNFKLSINFIKSTAWRTIQITKFNRLDYIQNYTSNYINNNVVPSIGSIVKITPTNINIKNLNVPYTKSIYGMIYENTTPNYKVKLLTHHYRYDGDKVNKIIFYTPHTPKTKSFNFKRIHALKMLNKCEIDIIYTRTNEERIHCAYSNKKFNISRESHIQTNNYLKLRVIHGME